MTKLSARVHHCLATTAMTALCLAAAPAMAQTSSSATPDEVQAAPPAAQIASAPVEAEAIVVTGSRIARSGFTAPTPTTVIGIEEIQKAAPANIADFVNQLPELSGSATTRTNNGNTSTGQNGLNTLNLRALGSNRTLVLLDGRRVVASSVDSTVDINNLPSALVQRVDIVTGGASAAYGSDAVAGVVNFVLNRKFTGIKGSLQGGISERGDDENVTGALAYGTSFADNRGHFIISAEGAYQAGINTLDPSTREWFTQTNLLINPNYTATNGQPQRITASGVNTSRVAQGGVTLATGLTAAQQALAYTQFGVGGAPRPFQRGSLIANPLMVGGNVWYEGNLIALDSGLKRAATFASVNYEISDHLRVTTEGSFGYSQTENLAAYQRYDGNLTVSATNPFIDAGFRAQAAALGISKFAYGYSTFDLGRPNNIATRKTYRAVAALDGDLFGDFKWNAYYQYGQTDTHSILQNTTNIARFAQAIDAVRDPVSGNIVCRSTLTAPTDGCVPLNIFGVGVASPAGIAYVKGVAEQRLSLKQNVAAASFSGTPFKLWAGPVSIAGGAEYRKEEVAGTGDPISLANGFYTGNYKGTNGSYDVKEVFGETIIPLAHDLPLLRSLEFNGAARYTNYSSSGGVVTWKAGLTWKPIDDLRLRFVRSRDIRAPNLSELYLAGQTIASDVTDPTRNLILTRGQRVIVGNLNLRPEKADTTIIGGVYSPSFLRRFNASIDYYQININDAITSLASQDLVDRCFRGETDLCQYVIRDANGVITQTIAKPINLATLKTRGLDLEASFRQPVGDIIAGVPGTLTLRALATHIFQLTTINGGIVTEAAGQNTGSVPKWRWFGTLAYDNDVVTAIVTVHGLSGGVYDNTWTSGVQIDNNHIAGATYVDLAGVYRFRHTAEKQLEAFFKIENLLDKDPPVVASATISGLQTNPVLYDVIGRTFRAGFRFRY